MLKNITLWKVNKYYFNDTPTYTVMPYNLFGHLDCCFRWYGIKGLQRCYLSKKHAERVADKLNNTL